MNENRYSVHTAAKYLSLSDSAVYLRAKKLKINVEYGLTVHDVKNIADYMRKPKGTKFRTTIDDLAKEMEETYRE